MLDVRLYELVPGAGGEFDRLFSDHALPMLRRHGIEVVAYGRSRKDPDRYCLVRRFATEAERDESLAAFYGSPEWLENYDERVTALIASYSTAVIEDMASSQSG